MTEERKEQALNFGALGYSDERVCIIWDCTPDELGDEYRKLYERGAAMSEYAIDVKLMEMALAGDLKAMDRIADRKEREKRRR